MTGPAFASPPLTDTTLLLQGAAAGRSDGPWTRRSARRWSSTAGRPARWSSGSPTRGAILTAHRLADLLGVTARTVTERTVKRGLPHVRLAWNGPPLFLLEDVIAWLRKADVAR